MHFGTLLEHDIDANYWIITINENRVTIASDGLVKAGTGTFAVILKRDDQKLYNISAAAVNNIKGKYRGVTAYNRSDVDILTEIEAMKVSGLRLKTKWVDAH
eukprot:1288347-Ditylum_brightwellii.AAC.1